MFRSVPWILLLLGLVTVARAAEDDKKTGVLKFSKTKLELGRMAVGSSTTRVITVKNQGTRDVHIRKINVNCGCARGRANKNAIPAGESIELLVTSKPTKIGKQTGRVFIYTDDPREPRTVVRLTLEGFRPIKSQPEFVQFGDVALGKIKRLAFELQLPTKEKFRIAKLNYNDQLFDVVVDKSATTGNVDSAKIHVVLKKTAPEGRFRESVNIDLATTPNKSCAVALYGNVQGDLMVAPQSLLFLGVSRGATVEKTARITSRSGQPFRILSVDSNLGFVAVKQAQTISGETEIVATLRASSNNAKASGIVTVTTDRKNQPTLEIPVRIRFRRR